MTGDAPPSQLTPEQVAAAWETYKTDRADQLRRRRARLRFSNFTVMNQIGEGGYGQVYLARKNDTGEVCAVKRMSKAKLVQLGCVSAGGWGERRAHLLTRLAAQGVDSCHVRCSTPAPPPECWSERAHHDGARPSHGRPQRVARPPLVRLSRYQLCVLGDGQALILMLTASPLAAGHG